MLHSLKVSAPMSLETPSLAMSPALAPCLLYFSSGTLSPADIDLCAVPLSPPLDEAANSRDFVSFVPLSPQL